MKPRTWAAILSASAFLASAVAAQTTGSGSSATGTTTTGTGTTADITGTTGTGTTTDGTASTGTDTDLSDTSAPGVTGNTSVTRGGSGSDDTPATGTGPNGTVTTTDSTDGTDPSDTTTRDVSEGDDMDSDLEDSLDDLTDGEDMDDNRNDGSDPDASDGGETSPGPTDGFGLMQGANLVNASTLLQLDPGENVTLGFVLEGTAAQRVLVRAVSDGLAKLGLDGGGVDPVITVYGSDGHLIGHNDNWSMPAVVPVDDAGSTTNDGPAEADATNAADAGSSGPADQDASTAANDGTAVGGLTRSTRISGGNPAMTANQSGMPVDTRLDANGIESTTELTGAFALDDEESNDAALVLDLPPGAYTVVVTSNGTANTNRESGEGSNAVPQSGAIPNNHVLIEAYSMF